MLIVAAALFLGGLTIEMPPKGENCKSLRVANKDRCLVCRNPNDASVRKRLGRKCLVALLRCEEQLNSSGSEPMCSPCDAQPPV